MVNIFRRKKSDKNEGDEASAGQEIGNFLTLRVKIPPNVKPGDTFAVYAGSRRVKLKCPPGAKSGQSLAITVPVEKTDEKKLNQLNGPNVNAIPKSDPQAYTVTIPRNTRGGTKFAILINGVNMMVISPSNASPGMNLQIVPPKSYIPKRKRDIGQKFEVRVPEYCEPGDSFALLANGVRVLVQCPENATGGQMVRFQLPFRTKGLVFKKLEYDCDGWARTLQITQMKFQWARVNRKQANTSNSIAKRMNQNAYVRHISKHGMELIPAQCELVESAVISSKTGEEICSCTDLVEMQQTKPLNEKVALFRSVCKKLGRGNVKKAKSFICINVRRDHLLLDSMQAVIPMSPDDLRKLWRIQFIGEEGIDVGGLKREWFQLLSEEIFDLDSGMWMTCGENQMNLQIHPSSNLLNENHLVYFRFLGRLLGKALYDGELVKGHMVQTFYKHLLGWPVTFLDLEHLDPAYYKSIKALMEIDDVEYACLDFTVVEDVMGIHKTVELIPNGESVDVTNKNIVQYLEAVLDYRLVGRVRNQLREMLLGFTDVIPPSLLTIFDYQELELLLCGLPHIDLEDWMNNTLYAGVFSSEENEVCQWFWETVHEMEEENKARLLQFVTGTSGVPPSGFATLQGNDGGIHKFTIHGVPLENCLYPRAHTCFNRIDLPLFESKEQLKERVVVAITMVSTGFDLE